MFISARTTKPAYLVRMGIIGWQNTTRFEDSIQDLLFYSLLWCGFQVHLTSLESGTDIAEEQDHTALPWTIKQLLRLMLA